MKKKKQNKAQRIEYREQQVNITLLQLIHLTHYIIEWKTKRK